MHENMDLPMKFGSGVVLIGTLDGVCVFLPSSCLTPRYMLQVGAGLEADSECVQLREGE